MFFNIFLKIKLQKIIALFQNAWVLGRLFPGFHPGLLIFCPFRAFFNVICRINYFALAEH